MIVSRGTAQRFDPDEGARDALLERFLAAAEEGDLGPSRSRVNIDLLLMPEVTAPSA